MFVLIIQLLYKTNMNILITLGFTALYLEPNPLGTWWPFWNIFYILRSSSLEELVQESLDHRSLRTKLRTMAKRM